MQFSDDYLSAPWMQYARSFLNMKGPPNDSLFPYRIQAGTVFMAASKGQPVTHVATPIVALFSQSVGDGIYGEPWCAMFVNWCLQQAHVSRSSSSAAKSFVPWGKPVPPTWGSITVLHSATGYHVGFLWDLTKDGIYVLGGNQLSDRLNKRSDHAVTISRRSQADVVRASGTVAGYRWPRERPFPVLTNIGTHAIT